MAKGNPKGNPQNLVPPVRTTEEAQKRGRNGGIKSGIAKREKKLMSEIYAAYLAKKGNAEKIETVIDRNVMSGGPVSIAQMREIRESTEGQKVKTEGTMTVIIDNQDNSL